MAAESLAEHARDLLRHRPAEFVAARNELAKQLRAAGDKELAGRVAALRRVGVSDWALDVVAANEPAAVAAFLAARAAVSAAQDAALAGAAHDLRSATRDLRSATAELAERASAEAGARGVTGAGSSAIELGLHLAAVAGDPQLLAALAAGVLGVPDVAEPGPHGDSAPAAAVPFGGGGGRTETRRRGAPVADAAAGTPAPARRTAADRDQEAADRRDRAAAERAHRDLKTAAARHQRQLRQVERTVADAEAAVAAARSRLAAADAALAEAIATRDEAKARAAEFTTAVDDSAARLTTR